jgi:hypothetical protein
MSRKGLKPVAEASVTLIRGAALQFQDPGYVLDFRIGEREDRFEIALVEGFIYPVDQGDVLPRHCLPRKPQGFEGSVSISVNLAVHDQPVANRQLVRVPELDGDAAALAGGGYPNEDEDPLCIDVKEAFRLQMDRAAPRTAIDPAQELVETSKDWGVGVQARQIEFKVRRQALQASGNVAAIEKLISAAHDLDVLP